MLDHSFGNGRNPKVVLIVGYTRKPVKRPCLRSSSLSLLIVATD
jgi:hypothetical protein